MDDDTPNQPAPLTDEERESLLEAAVTSISGRAVQGVWHQSIILKQWFAEFSREELLEARAEAPDGGMESAQKAFNELPLEKQRESMERAKRLHRIACAEAVAQLEHVLLGLWEDPPQDRARRGRDLRWHAPRQP
jgi:hypothetical protein